MPSSLFKSALERPVEYVSDDETNDHAVPVERANFDDKTKRSDFSDFSSSTTDGGSPSPPSSECSSEDTLVSDSDYELNSEELRQKYSRSPEEQDSKITISDWKVNGELPSEIFECVRKEMPIQDGSDSVILQGIPDYISLPIAADHYPHPSDLLNDYFAFLDLRDRLWAEASVLESKSSYKDSFPNSAEIDDVLSVAMRKVCAAILGLECSYPSMANQFLWLRCERLQLYPKTHPLRILQPHLIPRHSAIPDFSTIEQSVAQFYFARLGYKFRGWGSGPVIC